MTPLQIRMLKNYVLFHANSPSLGTLVRVSLRSWAFLLLGTLLAILLIVHYQMTAAGCLMLGMLLGAFLRDLSRFRVLFATWPAIEDITNWERVHSILRAHGAA